MTERITLIGLGSPEGFRRASTALQACRQDEPDMWRTGGLITFFDGASPLHVKKTKTGWSISCTTPSDCMEVEGT